VITFIRYWYVLSANRFLLLFRNGSAALEGQIATRETLSHLTQPLFQDYTFQGRIVGFFFRLGRVFVGGMAQLLLAAGSLSLYVLWLLFPVLCIISIASIAVGPTTPATNQRGGSLR